MPMEFTDSPDMVFTDSPDIVWRDTDGTIILTFAVGPISVNISGRGPSATVEDFTPSAGVSTLQPGANVSVEDNYA